MPWSKHKMENKKRYDNMNEMQTIIMGSRVPSFRNKWFSQNVLHPYGRTRQTRHETKVFTYLAGSARVFSVTATAWLCWSVCRLIVLIYIYIHVSSKKGAMARFTSMVGWTRLFVPCSLFVSLHCCCCCFAGDSRIRRIGPRAG